MEPGGNGILKREVITFMDSMFTHRQPVIKYVHVLNKVFEKT